MSKGAPLLPPLSLAFASSTPARRVRPPRKDEARVAILNADGALLQERIGLLLEGGTRCQVQFEGEYQEATLTPSGWEYVVRPPPEDDEP